MSATRLLPSRHTIGCQTPDCRSLLSWLVYRHVVSRQREQALKKSGLTQQITRHVCRRLSLTANGQRPRHKRSLPLPYGVTTLPATVDHAGGRHTSPHTRTTTHCGHSWLSLSYRPGGYQVTNHNCLNTERRERIGRTPVVIIAVLPQHCRITTNKVLLLVTLSRGATVGMAIGVITSLYGVVVGHTR